MFSSNLICIICFLLPQYLAKKTDDPCSQFHDIAGSPLVECPAYDLDPNYVECYEAFAKKTAGIFQYWCWNRLDNDETILKNLTISTAYVNDDELFQQINKPFTSMVYNDGINIICSTNNNLTFPSTDDTFYCPTSTSIPVVQFQYFNFENPDR